MTLRSASHGSLGAAAAVLAATTVTVSCAGPADSAARGEGSEAGASAPARVVDVAVRTVRSGPFVDRLHLTGTVEAERTVELTARESGQVEALPAEKGDRLEAGAVLAELDARELRAQLQEARAQAELARETWERRRQLYEDEGAISELSYIEARTGAERADARVKRLEARLDDKTIEAPFPGILDERPVEIGTTVSPGDVIATMVDVRPAKVSAGVPERYADDVAVGDSVTVTVPSLGDATFRGALAYVGAAVSRDSRTLPVEIEIPNVEGHLKPRMVADVSLVRKRWEEAVSVPQDAVLRTADGFAVYVVEEGEEGSISRRRAVELGARESDRVLVEDGLAPGDRLVTVGQQQLADGDRVRLAGGGADASGDSVEGAAGGVEAAGDGGR